jgi:hypothetical protein
MIKNLFLFMFQRRLISGFLYCIRYQNKKDVRFQDFWKERKCNVLEYTHIYMRQHEHFENDKHY